MEHYKEKWREIRRKKKVVIRNKKCDFFAKQKKFRAKKVGKLLISHRSTIYPCYVPILGDSTGAGRTRLTRDKGTHLLFTDKFN